MSLFPMTSGALFSVDRRYRYKLWRIWDENLPILNFLMLNPSKANETDSDPTVTRCMQRAKAWGYGALYVTNAFAYCATDPQEMMRQADPVGSYNDSAIIEVALLAKLVICGWGNHAGGRGHFVLNLLENIGRIPHALKLNSDGSPAHPLYQKYDIQPFPMKVPGIKPFLVEECEK